MEAMTDVLATATWLHAAYPQGGYNDTIYRREWNTPFGKLLLKGELRKATATEIFLKVTLSLLETAAVCF